MQPHRFLSAPLCALIGLLILGFLSSHASGQLIDFESTPAGAIPVDDAFLVAPYNLTGGGTVRFFFDVNPNNEFDAGVDDLPVFEKSGDADPNGGFSNDATGIPDTANGGLGGQLGDFFLRQRQPGSPPPPFIIDYNTATPINGLHGEIWDIDGAPGNTEGWKVEVLDSLNNVLTFQFSPPGNSLALDGLPWDFVFTGLPGGVDKLRITFMGTKATGLGLAFNNFDPLNAPEPGSALAAGCGAIVVLRRRIYRSV